MKKLFYPSFIYSISWEDFSVDTEYMKYNKDDTVLSLTGGGCNSMNILLSGATVYSTDTNPPQNHLLELKKACALHSYELLWSSFGDGSSIDFERIKVFLSTDALQYWKNHLHYFSPQRTVYTYGGMGVLVRFLRKFNWHFPDLNSQKAFKNSLLENRFLNTLWKGIKFFNLHYILSWYLLGVPKNQLNLIPNIEKYVSNVTKVFEHIKLDENHYYYLVCNGKYKKNLCPDYLLEENYPVLKENLHNLIPLHQSFYDALLSRTYTKCVLMDHIDWLPENMQKEVCNALAKQVTKTIILRSASEYPPYIDMLKNNGFIMTCVNSHSVNTICDKINMYASTWIGTKLK